MMRKAEVILATVESHKDVEGRWHRVRLAVRIIGATLCVMMLC